MKSSTFTQYHLICLLIEGPYGTLVESPEGQVELKNVL